MDFASSNSLEDSGYHSPDKMNTAWIGEEHSRTKTDRFTPFKSTRGLRKHGNVQSAPLLPAALSTQGQTWYTGNSSLSAGSRQSCWRPLGATWRDWESDGIGRMRSSADDGSSFIHGCVPHWAKDTSVRGKGLLEHELTWAYYRMRRHVQHPVRKQMGQSASEADATEDMRFGTGNGFDFWRDLRPPFYVLKVQRKNGDDNVLQPHADGELYKVTYECGIEYGSEHTLDAKGEGGYYDNRIHGDALVRFSNSFPQKRPLHIVSWGKPVLNWSPSAEENENPPSVDPEVWMPIAEELGIRADAPSMETCRALTRAATSKKQAKDRRGVEVPELERLLLGPHASLPRLAAATQNLVRGGGVVASGASPGKQGARKRSHTVFTPAAGFVRYAG